MSIKFERKGSSMGSVNEFAGVRSRGEVGPDELTVTTDGGGELEPKSEASHSGSGVPNPVAVLGEGVVGVWFWSSESRL